MKRQPRIIQRAKSLKAALEQIAISAEPEELIVGNRTAGVRYGVVFPESGSTWVDKEFETLPTRPQDRFNVHQEDIDTFRQVIKPYWKGKSLEDILAQRYGKEIDEIAKVVKINQKDHAQGHICPNCEKWLEMGPKGLQEEAEAKLKPAVKNIKTFMKVSGSSWEGAGNFMMRYHDFMMNLAEKETDENKKKTFLPLQKTAGT